MFPCQACDRNCATVLAYVRHMKIHKKYTKLNFFCVLPDCSQTYKIFILPLLSVTFTDIMTEVWLGLGCVMKLN